MIVNMAKLEPDDEVLWSVHKLSQIVRDKKVTQVVWVAVWEEADGSVMVQANAGKQDKSSWLTLLGALEHAKQTVAEWWG